MSTSSSRQTLQSSASPDLQRDTPATVISRDLGLYVWIKSLLDMLVSIAALILLSPMFLLVALVVRFDSPGPVIYRQTRVGRHGTNFTLYKFRTMRTEAPTLTTEQMKGSTISYYTRSGVILRRFSLDELPQLWNVLTGTMSIVGPRPSLPTQTWLNTMRDLAQVSQLKPGITGWAQVKGRDDLTDTEKITCDTEYRQKISFQMDVKIVLMTVRAIFVGTGAN